MMWLDVLDLPMVAALDAVFFEEGPSEEADESVADRSASERRYGQGCGLVPTGVSASAPPAAALTADGLPVGRHRRRTATPSWSSVTAAKRKSVTATPAGTATSCPRCAARCGASSPDTPRWPTSRPEPACAPFSTAPERRALLARSSPSRRVTSSSSRRGASTRWTADSTLDIFTTSDAPVLDALGLFRRALALMTADPTEVTEDVLIVGGGIGGLATALATARAGRSVRVIEQALEFGEIGAGLQLGPNAMRAFDRLGVYDAVARSAVFPSRGVFRDAVDGRCSPSSTSGRASRTATATRTSSPTAATFSTLCSRLAGPSRASRWRTTARRSMCGRPPKQPRSPSPTARPTAPGSLVGADGIRSRVRHLLDDSDPTFSGHVAYRGAICHGGRARRRSWQVASDEVLLWIGPGIHLMQYPVRSGTMYNQVAVYERPAGRGEAGGRRRRVRRGVRSRLRRGACLGRTGRHRTRAGRYATGPARRPGARPTRC